MPSVGALAVTPASSTMLVGGAGAAENNFIDGDPFNGNDVLLSRIAGAGTVFNLSRAVSPREHVQQIIHRQQCRSRDRSGRRHDHLREHHPGAAAGDQRGMLASSLGSSGTRSKVCGRKLLTLRQAQIERQTETEDILRATRGERRSKTTLLS